MAITNPALVLSIEALFGFIRPRLNDLLKLGAADFSGDAPNLDIKPGAVHRIPISSVSGALEYNEKTNNYLTGGTTGWAELTCTHFLKGYDITGTDVDRGVDASRMKQLFSRRAGGDVSISASNVTASALDSVTLSTGITLPAAPSYDDYDGLFGKVEAKNKVNAMGSVLAVSGTELGKIKSAYHAQGINFASNVEIAAMLGFADITVASGVVGRMWVVPPTALGYIARVPAILAKYISAGTETDPETGLSIGIVLADDQATNRQIVNADLWFGCAVQSASVGANTAGIVKVGTDAG